MTLPHASARLPGWSAAWVRAGRMVVMLDFDGTLAPIVERPEQARLPDAARTALERLRAHPGIALAVVSGRGLADVRQRVGIPGIDYAGNHGMEIDGPSGCERHAGAAAARPRLDLALARLTPVLAPVAGALLEDKGLTLSVHYRQVARPEVPALRGSVARVVRGIDGLRLTEGREVLEVRPDVPWDKGRAVAFLLDRLQPPAGAPVLYLGDDRTDEDAFRALRDRADPAAEGVIVADAPPGGTAAVAFVRGPDEVARLLAELAARAPS